MDDHRLPLGRRALRGLVPLALAALALSGCSALTGGAATGPATTERTTGGGTEQGRAAAQATLQSGDLPVLATHEVNANVPASVDLNEVRVDAKVTQVTFTARNNSNTDIWSLSGSFADGLIQYTGSGTDQGPVDQFTVDGVYLIDPVNAKRYLAARAEDGSCACSGNLPYIDPGGRVTLTVLFAAPPAGVDAVDVHIPGAAPFVGAPVSR